MQQPGRLPEPTATMRSARWFLRPGMWITAFSMPGYQYNFETGLYYLNARYYDSTTGRYYDPLSLNWYTYCQNNPVRYTDPSGHSFFTILFSAVVGATIGAAVELVSQVFVEKQDEVDWKAVGFEAGVGALSAVCGGIFGKAGSGAVKAAAKTGKGAVKEAAKRVVKAGVSEAAAGFATDTAKQILVEGKELQRADFSQAVKTSVVASATGMLGAVIGIFRESAKEAQRKVKEPRSSGLPAGCVQRRGGSRRAGILLILIVYRRPADYPNLRSIRGSYAYIGKYVEVDYVGDNPWEKTAGYYSSWYNAGNGAAGKQIGNSVAEKEDSFTSVSGRSAKVAQIVEVMRRGKISDDGYRVITDLDDRTRVIFGLDVGDRAHRLDIGGYTNPVDHMNIQIQVKKTHEKVRIAWDLHLILDKNRQVINQIITGDWARRK